MLHSSTIQAAIHHPTFYQVSWEPDEHWNCAHPHESERFNLTVTLFGVTVFEMFHAGCADGWKAYKAFGPDINRVAANVAKAAVGNKAYAATRWAKAQKVGSVHDFEALFS